MKKQLETNNLSFGFTLIELLAVIIVLAVIALITTPVILDVVENAKESSRISSVNGLLDATRLYMDEALLDDSVDLSGNLLDIINNRVKGTKPDEGEIRIDGNDIGIAVKIDGYCYIKDYSEEEIRKTNDSECNIYKVVEAISYGKTNVIAGFEINYDSCMEEFEDENICMNKEKMYVNDEVNGSSYMYLNDYIMYATYEENFSINDFVDSGLINIKYKEDNNTCYSYYSVDYDINYDVCMAEFYDEAICSGEKVDLLGDGNLITLKEYANSILTMDDLFDFVKAGLAENLNFWSDETDVIHIINYRCGLNNEYDMPEILDVEIPTTINGKKIIEVSHSSFEEKGLTSVDLHNSIYLKSIGESAFEDNEIVSIKLPNNLENLECYAFWNNQISGELDLSNLTNLTTIIGFSGNRITSVKLSPNVINIGSYKKKVAFGEPRDSSCGAFSSNQISGELDLSNLTNLEKIYPGAFAWNKITSLKIPSSVTSIGSDDDGYHIGAFGYNPNLTLIEIDKTKDAIGGAPWGAENAEVIWLRDSE